jgi:iron complex outermembrane receptor protein
MAFAPFMLAQQLTISGSVSDGTGAVPDATVLLRDPTGVTSQMMTNATGQYRFDGLRAGAYEITVIREGFVPATRGLTMSGESRTVDVTLEVGGITTTVDVTDVAGRATAAGMDIPNRELPNYVVTVNSRTLQEQGINDLPAALENISGVITQVQYGVYEWYTIGGITQQSGNDFLYVDGMTLTGNRSITQLNNIEEVQVLKGPNSILYGGSGAGQGGMVNLIRKKPQATQVSDIRYRFGRWGLQEITTGAAGPVFGLERFLYRIDSSFSHRDGWRQNSAKRFNFSPSFTWLINSRMRLSANEALIRDRYTLDAGLRSELINRPGMPFDRKMNPEGDFQLTRDWQNQLVYTWNVTDRLVFNNTFFNRKNRDQYLDAESMSYNAALDQVNRSYLYFQHNRRPRQNITEVTGDYSPGGVRHRFMVRYDYSNQYNYSNRTGPTPGSNSSAALPLPPVPVQDFIAGTWVDTAPVYTNFPITRVDYSTNRYHGIVLQDQVTPVRWIGFNFTLSRREYKRHTHNDVYDNGQFVSAGNDVRITNNTRSNYRAGATLIAQEDWPALVRGMNPYFSYNSSFNPVNSVQPDGTPLEPVINESYEIGNKWQGLNNRLTVLTAVRRIQDKNRVISLGGGFFEQVGAATTYNGDIDIQGQLGGGLAILANYGYADSKIEPFRSDGLPQANAGRRFPHAPKHTARLWLTKSFLFSPTTLLTVSLGNRYVYRYFTNSANTVMIPSRGTMDGAVSLRRGRYDVSVNLANITNKEHYFVSQINGGGQLYPGQPFSATVTVGYRFQ